MIAVVQMEAAVQGRAIAPAKINSTVAGIGFCLRSISVRPVRLSGGIADAA